jgi:cell division protein FtsL
MDDLTKLAMEAAITLLSAVASLAIGFITHAVQKRLNTAEEVEVSRNLQGILNQWVGTAIKVGVALAAERLAAKVPDTMGKLKLDQSHLTDMLQARVDNLAVTQGIPNSAVPGCEEPKVG